MTRSFIKLNDHLFKIYLFRLIIIEAIIFDSSSASFNNSFNSPFSIVEICVSLIRQIQYFVSFADFKAIV